MECVIRRIPYLSLPDGSMAIWMLSGLSVAGFATETANIIGWNYRRTIGQTVGSGRPGKM